MDGRPTNNPGVKLVFRAPANRAFVQGYPGLPEPDPTRDVRPRCTATGTVELRTSKPLKAEWLRISLFKTETLPKEVGGPVFRENVHGAVTLWAAPSGADYGVLDSKDFPFALDIPAHMPSSVDVAHGNVRSPPGIAYCLEVTLMERSKKKGLLRKENQPLSSFVQPIEVLSHDLHPSWPAHQVPRQLAFATPLVELGVVLPNRAVSPGTTLSFPLTLVLPPPSGPTPPAPLHVRHIQLTLFETTTFLSSGNPLGQRKHDVAQSRLEAGPNEVLTPGPQGGRSWTVVLAAPGSRVLGDGPLGFTVKGAHVRVEFALRIEVFGAVGGGRAHGGGRPDDNGGLGELVASAVVDDVLVDWMQAGREAETVREIGFVPGLSLECSPSVALTNVTSPGATSLASSFAHSASFSAHIPSPPILLPPAATAPSPPVVRSPASYSPAAAHSPPPAAHPPAHRASTGTSFEQTYNSMLRPSSSSAASRAGTASVYLPEEQDEFFGSSISPSPPPSSAAHSEMGYGAPPSRRVSSSAAVPAMRFPSAQEEKAQAFAQAKAAVARVQDGLPPDDDSASPSTQPPTRTPTVTSSPQVGSSSSSTVPAWETAAAEKKRLFEQLQTKAAGSPVLDFSTSAAPPSMLLGAQTPNSTASSSAPPPAGSWETAAEEKARLFKEAQGRALQGRASSSSAAPTAAAVVPASSRAGSAPATNGVATQPPKWESAADEKARLFREAQSRAAHGAGSGSSSHPPPASTPPLVAAAAARRSSSGRTFAIASVPGHETAEQEKARLKRQYEAAQQAVSARQGLPLQTASSSSAIAAGGSSSSSAPVPVVVAPLNISKNLTPPRAPVAHPTADEEKARLRFLDAVAARDQVDRSSSSASAAPESAADAASFVSSTAPAKDEPIPYDALFGGSTTVASPPTASAAPTATDRALTEKEQQRRYYDAQEAVARSTLGFGGSSSSHSSSIPLPAVIPTPSTARPLANAAPSSSLGRPASFEELQPDGGCTTPTSIRPSVRSSVSSAPFVRDPEISRGKQRAPRPESTYSGRSSLPGQSAHAFALSSSAPPGGPSSPTSPPPGAAPAPPPPPPPPPAERPPDDYSTRYLFPSPFAVPSTAYGQSGPTAVWTPQPMPFFPPAPPTGQQMYQHPGLMPAWNPYGPPPAVMSPYGPFPVAMPASPQAYYAAALQSPPPTTGEAHSASPKLP